MKPPEDAPRALRRKVALDIGDHEDQKPQQYHDFHRVIQEKMDAAADAAAHVQPQRAEKPPDQLAEPLHAQHLLLNECHKTLLYI